MQKNTAGDRQFSVFCPLCSQAQLANSSNSANLPEPEQNEEKHRFKAEGQTS